MSERLSAAEQSITFELLYRADTNNERCWSLLGLNAATADLGLEHVARINAFERLKTRGVLATEIVLDEDGARHCLYHLEVGEARRALLPAPRLGPRHRLSPLAA